jgi:ABC-type bacteriocin/lantibiotic exporter with double-glycine peptidase domain
VIARKSRRRRVRYVPQMETADCGAASLCMILSGYGVRVSLPEVREECGVGRDGVNAWSLIVAARKFGLKSEGRKVAAEGLCELPLPAILHWEGNHFVVLERAAKRGAVIVDPAAGRRRLSLEELRRCSAGVALVMTPDETFDRSSLRRVNGARTLHRARSVTQPLVVLMGLSLFLEISGALMPAATQVVVDHVVPSHREAWFWIAFGVLCVTSLLRTILYGSRELLLRRIQFSLDLTLMSGFVQHLLHLPASYFDQRAPGDLSHRVEINIALRDLAIRVARACLDLTLLAVYGFLMFAYDRQLACVVLGGCALRALFTLSQAERGRLASASMLLARAREESSVLEALSSAEAVKASGAEVQFKHQYENRLAARLESSTKQQRVSSLLSAQSGMLQAMSVGLVVWLGGRAVIAGQITPGVYAGFLALQQLLLPPVDSATAALAELAQVRGLLDRLDDVLLTPVRQRGSIRLQQVLAGRIRLDGVGFRYGARGPWIVRNVSLDIRPGEKVAFVGRSGQGKSTLAKLVLGLLVPTEGRVLLDEQDLSALDLQEVLPYFGVVLQDPFLLDDTIRNNLTLGVSALEDHALWHALRAASLEDVVAAMPGGLDAGVGPAGQKLSGGQRQRLCVARAIVRRPRVLVLDESTSALDRETEQTIHRNLSELDITRIVIAHRLATVRDADRVFEVSEGGIADVSSTYLHARRAGYPVFDAREHRPR